MTWERLIDGLAVVGAVTCLYWAARLLIRFLGWVERSEIERQAREAAATESAPSRASKVAAALPPIAAAATAAIGDIPPEHVVVIAAAIAAIGGHRIVMISDDTGARAWTSEGRWLHQTSHRPH